jgi:hypothetical protein
MKTTAILSLGALLMLTSCATIFNRAAQPVKIESTPSGAAFSITNRAGAPVQSGTTPTTLTLPTSSGYFRGESYQITFKKSGSPSTTVTLDAGISGWYFGNLVIGGAIGMLVIDPLSGSMWTLPDGIAATLGSSEPTLSLKIIHRSAVPKELENRLKVIPASAIKRAKQS